jgi:hypothetical protein
MQSEDIIINFAIDGDSICWSIWGPEILDVGSELNVLDNKKIEDWEWQMDVVMASVREAFVAHNPTLIGITDVIYDVMLGGDYRSVLWQSWLYWTIVNIAKDNQIPVVMTNCQEKALTSAKVVPLKLASDCAEKEGVK